MSSERFARWEIAYEKQTKTHLEKIMNSLKTQLRLASLLTLILLACTAAYGQLTSIGDSHAIVLTVKVPFEFVVGNQTFPAGTYRFRSLLNSVPGRDTIDILEVRGTEGLVYQAIVTDVVGGEQSNDLKLVFVRRGGRAFLSEVWEPGKAFGCRLHGHKELVQTTESENDKVTLLSASDWR